MRPKVKDANGKDIEFGLDARIDTGRWLTVRGTVQQGRGLLWINSRRAGQPLAGQAADRHRDGGRTDPRARRPAARGDFQRADRGRNRRPDGNDGADSVLEGHRSADAVVVRIEKCTDVKLIYYSVLIPIG